MSYLDYSIKTVPQGISKLLYINWPLVLLIISVASLGFLMLFSVSGGDWTLWAEPQIKRFVFGLFVMFVIALIPIYFWRGVSMFGYIVALVLLIGVDLWGTKSMGAQRWIDLGFMRLQPSELMKITLVMFLAAYYDWLPWRRRSNIFWVLIAVLIIALPAILVLRQPDLGTTVLLLAGGGSIMFMAGVHWGYFLTVAVGAVGTVIAVFQSHGTSWQLLQDYQFRRIDTFLNPAHDVLGAGYHITQAQIALGSGGLTGRGFMEGTQSRLNFLPEKHTDFIFTTLAEEFGFFGTSFLLSLYSLIILFSIMTAFSTKDRYSFLLIIGLITTFFLFFSTNMAMVMGLAPVVGVPLPLVSYGGSAMLVLMIAFGLIQSAHVHQPR